MRKTEHGKALFEAVADKVAQCESKVEYAIGGNPCIVRRDMLRYAKATWTTRSSARLSKNSRAEWYYESTKDDSEVEAAIRQKAEATNNSFHMNFKIGVMETESKFCTRSPGVRHRTAISNGLTDRTEGLFLTPTFSEHDSLNNLAPMEYRLMRTG
nr:hypothetical protein [Fibrobacter sp.]